MDGEDLLYFSTQGIKDGQVGVAQKERVRQREAERERGIERERERERCRSLDGLPVHDSYLETLMC